MLETVKKKYPDLKIIFEIGAHKGNDIKQILSFWPESKVYAFEADPVNYQHCKENIGNDPRVNIYNTAITNYSGKVKFNRYFDVEKEPNQDSSLFPTAVGSTLKPGKGLKDIYRITQTFQEIEVPCVSIKDFCDSNNITNIDAIFMDIQGGEFVAFDGCGTLLNTLKATIFEWSTGEFVLYEKETDFEIIKGFLESIGMEETERSYQFKGINGDSLFTRK